jgi:hypothetical protein
MNFKELLHYVCLFGEVWDGKEAILDMKNNNYNQWKQMEWAGFYLQFVIQTYNENHFMIPGKTINKTTFDAHWISSDTPIDVKFHSNFDTKGKHNRRIPLNDCLAMDKAIDIYGSVGIIVLFGDPVYDESGEFKLWHDTIKGEKSNYVKQAELENKNSRARKTLINLTHTHYYSIDENNMHLLDGFQKGMVNSNGNLRNEKYMLDMNKISPKFTFEI